MSSDAVTAPAAATAPEPSVALRRAALVARILLGLLFVFAGASGFVLVFGGFPVPPAPSELATQFQDAFFRSRWVLFTDAVQLLSGVLLLANRYVALALVALAGVIANIVVFHVTMAPSGLPIALVVVALWIVLALRYRASLAPLLAAKAG